MITQHDPRGSSYDLIYPYSGLDQIAQTLSLNLPTPIGAQYDALGGARNSPTRPARPALSMMI